MDNVTLPDDVSEERDATPSSIEDTVPPTTEDPSEPLAESSTEPSVVNSTEASSVDSTCDQPQASSEPDLPTSGDVSKAEESSAEESTAEKSAAVDQGGYLLVFTTSKALI